jgi:anti-sigma factor RsiW
MKCLNRETLFAYSHTLLDAREAESVRAHVAECPACRAIAVECQKLDAVLDGWKPAEPSPWFDARVRAALASQHAKARMSSNVWLRTLIPITLALVVIVGVRVLRRPANDRRATPWVATRSAAAPQGAPQTSAPANQTVAENADASQELKLDQNLPILEDYDMLANFDVLSEMPKARKKADD